MNTPTTNIASEPNNAFARLLAEFREGASLAELSDKLQTLVAAVRLTGRKGKLSYCITIKPAATGNSALIVLDEMDVKLPKDERSTAIFFATEENALQRNDPKQMKLNLREVTRPEPVEALSLPSRQAPPIEVEAQFAEAQPLAQANPQ